MVDAETAILMGSFNGARFLNQQLDSILGQSLGDWSLWVSDDGSRDDSVSLVRGYANTFGPGRLHVLKGPGEGFVRNFLSLVCNPLIDAKFYAYADQDDVWLSDKLERAVGMLRRYPTDVPALYCSRTLIVDAAGNEQGQSLLDSAVPSFGNALIQNIASGNTMVFNAAARNVLMEAGSEVDVFAHDWWTYLVVTAVGGSVFFDSVPFVRYRQHGTNQVGASVTLAQLLRRTRLDRNGRLRSTLRRNVAALALISDRMTPENLELLDQISLLWDANPARRLGAFFRLPFKRQRFLGNCSLALAVLLGRV